MDWQMVQGVSAFVMMCASLCGAGFAFWAKLNMSELKNFLSDKIDKLEEKFDHKYATRREISSIVDTKLSNHVHYWHAPRNTGSLPPRPVPSGESDGTD